MKVDPVLKCFQEDEKGRWIVAFGKYKGEFLSDAMIDDPEYFDWLCTQDIPEQVRDTIEAERD